MGAAPLPGSAAPESTRPGRLLLFFVPDTPRWATREPAEGPFFDGLQPIASIAIGAQPEGSEIPFDFDAASVFAAGLERTDGRGGADDSRVFDHLEGAWRIQAVLDSNTMEPGHLAPGNLLSAAVRVDLAADRRDEIVLTLEREIPAPDPAPMPGIEWVSRRSALLSEFRGHEVSLRAGVVLPFGYADLSFPRRQWPTIFVVGGFGADHLAAIDAAPALREPSARGAVPQAVWVFLDPNTPHGHGGFCDSETNGPLGRALVEEFIPFLEERFRLVPRTEARIVTGHSSGGWTAVHLAIAYPETFGAAFASAPDPLDFTAFQRTDLYNEDNLFIGRDGVAKPSHRRLIGLREERVTMTVRDEIASEQAIDPDGRSGCQWAAWNAMWSPFDASRGSPRPICDARSGAIDPVTAEAWSRHDIARRLDGDPRRIGAIFRDRIRILCGTRDSFYLNLATARLKARLATIRDSVQGRDTDPAPQPGSGGYIELLEDLTHDSVYPIAQLRFQREMQAHLRRHGLADPLPTDDLESRARPPLQAP